MNPARRAPASRVPGGRGFTFLEVLVVMGMLALLMGIGVGYLTNIKGAAGASQSLAILRETAAACKQSSNGGTRAIFDLREDFEETLFVGAAIAQPVLTHNFEALDIVSRDYPVDPLGSVEIISDGYTGNAGRFRRGGALEFAPQSSFAMTEGLAFEAWIRPDERAPNRMTLLKGEGAYEIQLVKDQQATSYDVLVKLNLRDEGEDRSIAQPKEYKTKGAPVRADGVQWTHVRVVFDGGDASILVGGFERYRVRKVRSPATESSAPTSKRKVIAIPDGGLVRLTISDPSTSFVGAMDQMVLGGVFRSSEGTRKLVGLRLLRPKAPVRIVWRNGRLDPDVHAADVVLLFQEIGGRQGGPTTEMRFGLYGLVTQKAGGAP